jgi:hypothetical protein
VVQAASDAAALPNEELVVARVKRDSVARLAAPTSRHAKRKRAAFVLALAAASVASVAAAATFVIVRGAPGSEAKVTTAPRALPQPPAPPQHSQPVTTVEAPEPAEEAVKPNDEREPHVARSVPRAAAESGSASELFSRANQARRDGKTSEAVGLYRALQERFAGSSEELVSRVTLGRLLLDRLGDSRGALVQFNSYLASPARGALREEAMVGRALALGRMGRSAEERAAWQALLDSFPSSTQRKRAQARLVELGGAAPAAVGSGAGTGRGGGAR